MTNTNTIRQHVNETAIKHNDVVASAGAVTYINSRSRVWTTVRVNINDDYEVTILQLDKWYKEVRNETVTTPVENLNETIARLNS